MDTNKPLVSVVIAVFNGEKYIKEAIESILNQTYRNYELIIINDGSTDNTGTILKSYNQNCMILHEKENNGLAPSLNIAIKHASGKYIARLDADDVSFPRRLEKQVEFMEEHQNCAVSGGNAEIIDMDGKYLYQSNVPIQTEAILKKLEESSPFYHSSVIFRKDIYEKCGGYYEKIRHHFEDYILWNRMKNYGELYNLPDILIKYRIVPDAITNRDKKTGEKMIEIAKRILKDGELSDQDAELLKQMNSKTTNRDRKNSYYSNLGCIMLYRQCNNKEALKYFLHSFFCRPAKLSTLFFILLSLMPRYIIRKWTSFRKISY